ncbi:hypothetical protein HPP92_023504 [Vanilla planifolia]|uniref:Uncharacterized protein n=1 Tax=Vanilla planifolia TaxID=51239 RepID=A0A835PP22_VANPL|nr:hypothetical protein HPP92_023504 [Vanilla planifolia]
MGCCFSSPSTAAVAAVRPLNAMVVSAEGILLEYADSMTAAEVMGATGGDYALCNTDELFFNAYPPAVAQGEQLGPGQMYFLLPVSDLRRRLGGMEMAALAMRASAAMKRAAESRGEGGSRWRRRRSHVC